VTTLTPRRSVYWKCAHGLINSDRSLKVLQSYCTVWQHKLITRFFCSASIVLLQARLYAGVSMHSISF